MLLSDFFTIDEDNMECQGNIEQTEREFHVSLSLLVVDLVLALLVFSLQG